MAISQEEARLKIIEQIANVLTFVNAPDDSTDDEKDDIFDQMIDLADIIVLSLGVTIQEVVNNDELILNVKIKSMEEFIKEMLKGI